MVTEEGEAAFDSEVVQQLPPPLSPAQEASVATATTTKKGSIKQVLWESIANSNPSVNNNIVATVCNSGRNLAGANASELLALGLEVENEDHLPENQPIVGSMNCVAEAMGNWIVPTICPCAQEICCNTNGTF